MNNSSNSINLLENQKALDSKDNNQSNIKKDENIIRNESNSVVIIDSLNNKTLLNHNLNTNQPKSIQPITEKKELKSLMIICCPNGASYESLAYSVYIHYNLG